MDNEVGLFKKIRSRVDNYLLKEIFPTTTTRQPTTTTPMPVTTTTTESVVPVAQRKQYIVIGTLKNATGILSRLYKNAIARCSLNVDGTDVDFKAPQGKKFILSGRLLSVRSSEGKDLLGNADISFENYEYIFTGWNLNDKFETEKAVVNYEGFIMADWSSIENLTAHAKIKTGAAYLVNNLEVTGSGHPPTG